MSAARPDPGHRPVWGWGRILRASLLLGWAALIAKLFATGEMVKYMAPALDPLTALTALVLAAMGVMELAGGRLHLHDGANEAEGIEQALTYLLVILPLALGILVTPRALGAGALGGESAARLLLAYAPGSPASTEPPAPARPIEDTADLLAYLGQAGTSGVGQRVRATGLGVRAAGLAAGELALLRFAIAHCVADARPVVLLVAGPAARGAETDGWVAVEGTLAVTERDGARLVTIAAERVQPIPEPATPYLGPSY